MKKKATIHIQQDEAFLEGINLITGLKINYERPILTQAQIHSLCIDENYTRREKAINILQSGQMLQKWSLFENLPKYLITTSEYQQILQLIQVYFEDLEPMLDILAVGLSDCMQEIINSYQSLQSNVSHREQFHLTEKTQLSIFRLCMRTFVSEKYNQLFLDQWSSFFDLFFTYLHLSKSPKINKFMDQCLQYISGSFSMNTPPERRRVAFEMIKGLIEHSQKIMERAKTKAAFFNNDTNSKTRMVICEAMGKLLLLRPDDEEIRKFILDYFKDSDPIVRQKSFYILLQMQKEKHLDQIINAIQQQEEEQQISCLVVENLETFVQNFHFFIRSNKRYKSTLTNLINGVLKSNDPYKISKVFPLLGNIYKWIFDGKEQEKENFFDLFIVSEMDFENEEIFKSLIDLYRKSSEDINSYSIRKSLQFHLHRNLRSSKIKLALTRTLQNLKLYLSVFFYESEEENNTYITLLAKLIEQSKWFQVSFLLSQLKRVHLNEQNFDRISVQLLRLILVCPYNLLVDTSRAILFLLLSKRKHLDFFLSIKDKLNCSKTWTHRRNYIILYAQIKAGSSYQFHKIIPILNYKILSKDKCAGVKLQFLKYAIKIYESIDPEAKLQKIALKQTVSELSADRDEDIVQKAKQVILRINQIEIDFSQHDRIAQRNSQYLAEEEKMRQREALLLKKTKTQRELGRKQSKSKTITSTSRSSIRLHQDLSRQIVKKEIPIINVQKLKRPSTVIANTRGIPPKQQKFEKIEKAQEEKKSTSINSINNKPLMSRIMSGQVKSVNKTMTSRKDSGVRK